MRRFVISGGAAGQQYNLTDTNISGNHFNVISYENAGNTFAGIVLMNRGTLRFSSDAALGQVERIRIDTWNDLGRLQFGSDNLTLNASRTIELVTLNSISSPYSLPVDTQAFNGQIDGQITGPGSLLKVGTGKLTLTNSAINYTGPTRVREGILSVNQITDAGIQGVLGNQSGNNALNLQLGGISTAGTLEYTGPTASTNRNSTLNDGGGAIPAPINCWTGVVFIKVRVYCAF